MLENLLNDQDKAAGFEIKEDDHLVYLFQHGHQVAVFSSSGMTKTSLRGFLNSQPHSFQKSAK